MRSQPPALYPAARAILIRWAAMGELVGQGHRLRGLAPMKAAPGSPAALLSLCRGRELPSSPRRGFLCELAVGRRLLLGRVLRRRFVQQIHKPARHRPGDAGSEGAAVAQRAVSMRCAFYPSFMSGVKCVYLSQTAQSSFNDFEDHQPSA